MNTYLEILHTFIFSPIGKILLIGIAGIILWMIFGREKIGYSYPNELMKKYSKIPRLLRMIWIIRIISFFIILFIIFPVKEKDNLQKSPKQREYVITLDISKSMESDDFLPSRIEYAKKILKRSITPDILVGYVIFAGKTFILSPISTDTDGILSLISTTSTSTINQEDYDTSGTNIGDALIQSSTLFSKDAVEKEIILITDGRANLGVDPLVATEEIKKNKISLSILALGSESGSLLSHVVGGKRELLLDASGNTQSGDIDLDTLQKMAIMTDGKIVSLRKDIEENIYLIPSGAGSQSMSIGEKILRIEYLTLVLLYLVLLHMFLSIVLWRKYKSL